MANLVLSLNAGSSSLKFALSEVRPEGDPVTIARGAMTGLGTGIATAPRMIARDAAGRIVHEHSWDDDGMPGHVALFDTLFGWVDDHQGSNGLIGVGHRIVHGGREFSEPVIVDAAILGRLDALCPLAPLHQPHNLAALRAAGAARPGLPQVACFDTAFHARQPAVATRFAIPHALAAEGVRRYGFHGLSYDYGSRHLASIDPDMARGRLVFAHLGNGASLCAIREGRSIDGTMGFTALDGLVMGTRCGSIDPGVLLYLQQAKGMSADDVEHLLYERSGLLGVSGVSSDMRELLASGDARAREAIDLFVYRVVRDTGALASVLGGLDGFVFTGGIGENAAEIRGRIVDGLAWLGLEIDVDANARAAPVISTPGSRVKARIVATDEEHAIAVHTIALIDRAGLRRAAE